MNRLIVAIIILFISVEVLCNNKTTEEAKFDLASSVVLNQKDSTIINKYDEIKRLYDKGDFVNSLNNSYSLLDLIEIKKDLKYAILTNQLIGDIFTKTNKNIKALEYYKRTYELYDGSTEFNEEINFLKNEKSDLLFKIAGTFQKLEQIDSAKTYYEKNINLDLKSNNFSITKAKSYSNLSAIYVNEGRFDIAKKYLDQAFEIHRILNNKTAQAASLNNYGSILLYEGDYLRAKEKYNKGIELLENIQSNNAIRYKEDLYYNMAYVLYKLKDYKAYDFQERSYEIKDSLRDKEVIVMIEELDAKYNFDTAKKLFLKEEENKRLKDQRTFWIFGIGSFIVMISLVYFLNLYKLKQKNLRLKLSQTQLIQNQNIEKLKSESQARILNATIDGKETERKEIAETLHDSVSALLSSANLHLMATKPLFKGDIPLEIDKTQNIIAEASQKIRDLSHTLVSSVLLKFGLNFAIKDIATKYSNSVLQIDTDISGLRRYHQDFEIKIYNIIQEFVNNILKHSKASYTLITLYEKDKNLCFQITDDGVGFDKNKVTNKDGLGLNQIEARIRMMNGKFLIESTIGEGTTISVELPVIEKS
ncbi:tetratricopeptide repeat-containing sensor histidine kinase [Polaribacter marinaquae]|uniref:Oxygen sensor histidine kinase NreB n=1 Tax=Polaribacter marinaquae TaxID=1642819 RepID=A0ABZ2TQ63_9FLAO